MKDKHSKATYSFDVFDTCLCRLCGEPRNMIEVLSLRVQKEMGEGYTEYMRREFVAVRATCCGSSLEEIYRQVANRCPLPRRAEGMARMELDTEAEMLVPIAATRSLVDSLRSQGDIIFISDMYLPDNFIREQLERHGFFRTGDRLYVSDNLGAWKRDGSLYRLVREREGLSYSRWHHYGDNRHSDYSVPLRLGIHAHWLHYEYLPYEENWRQLPFVGTQIGYMTAGISRAVRLQSTATESQKAFVCDISATFMTAWVLHVLTEARKHGIRRLYFCARDAYAEFVIARELQPLFPEIEVRYLFISSEALYNSPLAFDYLKGEGLADGIPSAIVDTCTSGKTLGVINQLLASGGMEKVRGFFIMKTHVTEYTPLPSHDADYLIPADYLNAVAGRRIRRVGGMRIFFELFFPLNRHSRVKGYEYHGDMVRPVFGKDEEDGWDMPKAYFKDNVGLISRYAQACMATGMCEHYDAMLTRIALPTLAQFVDLPEKCYLEYLKTFTLWGRPLVGLPIGKRKGVWKRGNKANALPGWMFGYVNAILSTPTCRRRLNRVVALFKAK